MTGTSHMVKEISSQSRSWMDTYASNLAERSVLLSFLDKIYVIRDLQIVITGAGSSAFIGEMVQYAFQNNTGLPVKTIPTTDLVTHPRKFFQRSVPALMISFARSGDSPESVAAYELAEQLTDRVYHLVITCSREGKLAKMAFGKKNAFIFLLPEETNDQAPARTSSFTSMALARVLISDIGNIEKNAGTVKRLSELGRIILDKYARELDRVTDMDFKRIVFTGSGPLKAPAKKSHLKVIELTDGQIICQYDSFLGFRDGPKAIIDASTLLVYIFSGDLYILQYEIDLVRSVNQTESFIFTIGIRQSLKEMKKLHLNLAIALHPLHTTMGDDFFSGCSVIPAQVPGFYKSKSLGFIPDSPLKKGEIHRGVQCINIYPY